MLVESGAIYFCRKAWLYLNFNTWRKTRLFVCVVEKYLHFMYNINRL